MKKERFKLIPAVYLMLLKDGKILMLRRFNTGYEDGNYSLPAGHLDEGETFSEAMVREAKEEVGIEIDISDLKIAHVTQRVPLERMDLYFIAEKWEGEITNMEPQKCDDLSWFDVNNLPKNTIPCVKVAIENAINNKFLSEVEI